MRKSILATLSLVCVLIAPLAFAEVPLVADVPFSFIVNNKVMPAGASVPRTVVGTPLMSADALVEIQMTARDDR